MTAPKSDNKKVNKLLHFISEISLYHFLSSQKCNLFRNVIKAILGQLGFVLKIKY